MTRPDEATSDGSDARALEAADERARRALDKNYEQVVRPAADPELPGSAPDDPEPEADAKP